MFTFTRIKLLLLLLQTLEILGHPNVSEFTYETCKQLNATVNITCTELDTHTTIVFNNEDHFKIYVSKDYQSFTISCIGTAEDMLQIVGNLPELSLGRIQDITIDGCIPFDDIFRRLGISTGTMVKLQRGVTNTPLKRSHLTSLDGVIEFVLSGFDQLDVDILTDMRSIETLKFAWLEAPLPAGFLEPISAHLRQIQMRDNRLQTPPARLFAPLHHLELLDLSYNGLSVIPADSFEQLYNLTELDLSNNRIERLPADVFRSLRELTVLYLSNNRLQQLELGTFAKLGSLQHLEIENNALDLDAAVACNIFDGLTKLEYLELSNNSLSVYCLPHHMGSVRVKVAHNRISALLVHAAGENQPRQLANLNLRNNRLRQLSEETLLYLHDSLADISLAHNPWQCDCASVLWFNFVKLNSKRVSDLEELSCADGNAEGQVARLTSSDVCKPESHLYYIIAIVALATVALTLLAVAVGAYRRAARRSAGKQNSCAESELS
ncbi:carboxypeptidase N subunit 2-like [Rhagoletis pomonella]|uniref:carboxypeptidase N subunit 2-like n=1 Tax=Rhagoletis pomonella TaxID=28610 RepID=UPI0017857AA3|nr:carboxypeptidase N subunit 2-like [Rhagoletis pomonella]